MADTINDIAVMGQILQRDQGGLLLLYDTYGRAVFSLAYRVLNNSVMAEEVTQDTFLKVWDRADQWDSNRGKLRNWLLTIAHFAAIDRLRKEQQQPVAAVDIAEHDESWGVLAQSDWQDNSALRLLVEQLPPEQARLIDLMFYKGMSHSQIAEYTRLPLGTVKTRLRSGLQKLRDLYFDAERDNGSDPITRR